MPSSNDKIAKFNAQGQYTTSGVSLTVASNMKTHVQISANIIHGTSAPLLREG